MTRTFILIFNFFVYVSTTSSMHSSPYSRWMADSVDQSMDLTMVDIRALLLDLLDLLTLLDSHVNHYSLYVIKS